MAKNKNLRLQVTLVSHVPSFIYAQTELPELDLRRSKRAQNFNLHHLNIMKEWKYTISRENLEFSLD